MSAVWRSDRQQRDPDCKIRQLHRQFCLQLCNSALYTSALDENNCPLTCYIPHGISTLERKFAQSGGAILNSGTLTVKYGNFTSNSALHPAGKYGNVCNSSVLLPKRISPNLLFPAILNYYWVRIASEPNISAAWRSHLHRRWGNLQHRQRQLHPQFCHTGMMSCSSFCSPILN